MAARRRSEGLGPDVLQEDDPAMPMVKILAGARRSIAIMKRLARDGLEGSLDEGLAALRERREPNFP
jgi:hypothetical protein